MACCSQPSQARTKPGGAFRRKKSPALGILPKGSEKRGVLVRKIDACGRLPRTFDRVGNGGASVFVGKLRKDVLAMLGRENG